MKNIKYIVIHCSDSPNEMDVSAKEIHRWHKERGWDGIGYHYVITRKGQLQEGRPEYWQGAHARLVNNCSIGICLVGKDEFNYKQILRCKILLRSMKLKYPNSEIIGHCKVDPRKTCPNIDVRKLFSEFF